MTTEDVREVALSLEGTSESRPFAPDRVVFKTVANNKVFAILSGHEFPDDQVTLKAAPEDVRSLKQKYDAVYPSYKLNKKYWVNVSLAGDVPKTVIKDLIKTSYGLVAPKKQARA